MNLDKLYSIAEKNNIDVLHHPMVYNGSMSIAADSGNYYIGLDESICDGSAVEIVHLSHELGHCMTGSFYNIYATLDNRRFHENRADKWAIRKLISKKALETAVASGRTEVWELAEYFNVTEQFMLKAICLYKYNSIATEMFVS